MALFRAIESAKSAKRRLFRDPLARKFLSPSLRLAAAISQFPFVGAAIPWILDAAWPGARTSGIARTRFIDDRLGRALHDGFKQVIILGAGFDSRAYRMEELGSVNVIEVDHPATSRMKRSILERSLGRIPSHVRFLEIDFNGQSLQETIRGLDFDAKKSCVIFTYVDKAVLDPNAEFDGAANAKARIARVGENWTFGFDPVELPTYLAKHGFRLVEDIGSREYRTLYMPWRKRLIHGYEWYRIAVAEG